MTLVERVAGWCGWYRLWFVRRVGDSFPCGYGRTQKEARKKMGKALDWRYFIYPEWRWIPFWVGRP